MILIRDFGCGNQDKNKVQHSMLVVACPVSSQLVRVMVDKRTRR